MQKLLSKILLMLSTCNILKTIYVKINNYKNINYIKESKQYDLNKAFECDILKLLTLWMP